jgi:branched-chain amino acid transport system substrate-binding protein
LPADGAVHPREKTDSNVGFFSLGFFACIATQATAWNRMMTRLPFTLPLCAAALLLLLSAASAWAKPPVHAPAPHVNARTAPAPAPKPEPTLRLGEINTYKRQPEFSVPYRRGWQLALEQLNASAGVLGRKIEVLSRDDNGSADDAVKAAQGLVEKDKVLAIFGGYSSESGLALAHYADQNKILYLAVAPLSQRLTWQEGNRYTFRLRPGAWMQAAAVAPKALGVRKLHWALVYEDTDSGRSTADAFKGLVKAFQSKTEFVSEQAVTPGKFDAAATVEAMAAAKPDAIFSMLTGAALDQWVHEGTAQHLFDQRPVVSLFTGDPENIETLGPDLPEGWIITGYPRDAIDTPANRDFVAAYRERYNEAPGTASMLGYVSMMSLAAGFKRAGTPDGEKLAQAFSGLTLDTPFGTIEYRMLDHQSTLGTYLGYTAIADGKPVMDNFVYASGARLQPLDEQIHRLRTADAGHAGSALTKTGDSSKTVGGAKPAKPARAGTADTPDLNNPPPALPDWPGGLAPDAADDPEGKTSAQAPDQAPAQTPAQSAVLPPAQAPGQTPAQAPAQTPARTPAQVPTQRH